MWKARLTLAALALFCAGAVAWVPLQSEINKEMGFQQGTRLPAPPVPSTATPVLQFTQGNFAFGQNQTNFAAPSQTNQLISLSVLSGRMRRRVYFTPLASFITGKYTLHFTSRGVENLALPFFSNELFPDDGVFKPSLFYSIIVPATTDCQLANPGAGGAVPPGLDSDSIMIQGPPGATPRAMVLKSYPVTVDCDTITVSIDLQAGGNTSPIIWLGCYSEPIL